MSRSALRRPNRVAEMVKERLANFFLHEVSDPRVGPITLMEVEIGSDLRNAKVFFCGPKEELSAKELKELSKGLTSVTPFLRRRLGEELALRSIPQLEFIRDNHHVQVSRLMQAFDSIRH